MERPTAIKLLAYCNRILPQKWVPREGMSAVGKPLLLRKRGRDFSLSKILRGWMEKRHFLIQKLRDSTIRQISVDLSEGQ